MVYSSREETVGLLVYSSREGTVGLIYNNREGTTAWFTAADRLPTINDRYSSPPDEYRQ